MLNHLRISHHVLLTLAFLLLRADGAPVHAQALSPLTVRESGSGLDHAVHVESPGLFRLGLDAWMNYGLTSWFDLVNDPEGKTDLLKHPGVTQYHGGHQGTLLNQVIFPDDLIAHVATARTLHGHLPRSVKILEAGAARVVTESDYQPVFSRNNPNIHLRTRYVIYASGRICATNTLWVDQQQHFDSWDQSVLTLPDPQYRYNDPRGRGQFVAPDQWVDASANWQRDAFKGCMLNLAGYNSWEILGNDATSLKLGKRLNGRGDLADGEYNVWSQENVFGWVRGSNNALPYAWSGKPTRYVMAYWDPNTPAPWTRWSQASVMMADWSENPHPAENCRMHAWAQTKRIKFGGPVEKFTLAAGQSITRHTLIHIGAKNSPLLPHFDTATAPGPYAEDYRTPALIDGARFDPAEGCYVTNRSSLSLPAQTIARLKPAFRFPGVKGVEPIVTLDGQALHDGHDYLWQPSGDGHVVVMLQRDLSAACTLAVKPGSTVP